MSFVLCGMYRFAFSAAEVGDDLLNNAGGGGGGFIEHVYFKYSIE